MDPSPSGELRESGRFGDVDNYNTPTRPSRRLRCACAVVHYLIWRARPRDEGRSPCRRSRALHGSQRAASHAGRLTLPAVGRERHAGSSPADARSTKQGISGEGFTPSGSIVKQCSCTAGSRAPRQRVVEHRTRAHALCSDPPSPITKRDCSASHIARAQASSVVAAAAAGGWRDLRTVQMIYQQADRESVRAVLLNPTQRLTATA